MDILKGNNETYNNDKPWFVMFHGDWSEHCKKMFRFWDEVADKYHKTINFGELECGENEDMRDRFSISTFPTFMYYPNHTNMYLFIGYRTIDNITEWIDQKLW